MIRRHEDVVPINPYPPCPCPVPPTPIIPVVSVSSVNGMTGDVKLKELILGHSVYNGTEQVIVTLEDLELETAVRYLGVINTGSDLDYKEVNIGDLYFCLSDKLLYLCTNDINRSFVNIRIVLTDEDIRTISIAGEKQQIINGNIDIPEATESKLGVVKLSEQIQRRPTDGCMVINFNNIMQGSISVDKLKGDLWLKADVSVQKPDEIVD